MIGPPSLFARGLTAGPRIWKITVTAFQQRPSHKGCKGYKAAPACGTPSRLGDRTQRAEKRRAAAHAGAYHPWEHFFHAGRRFFLSHFPSRLIIKHREAGEPPPPASLRFHFASQAIVLTLTLLTDPIRAAAPAAARPITRTCCRRVNFNRK